MWIMSIPVVCCQIYIHIRSTSPYCIEEMQVPKLWLAWWFPAARNVVGFSKLFSMSWKINSHVYLVPKMSLPISFKMLPVNNVRVATASFDGLVQDCSNSIANALELLQSCTKPSIMQTILYCAVVHHKRCDRIICEIWPISARSQVIMRPDLTIVGPFY